MTGRARAPIDAGAFEKLRRIAPAHVEHRQRVSMNSEPSVRLRNARAEPSFMQPDVTRREQLKMRRAGQRGDRIVVFEFQAHGAVGQGISSRREPAMVRGFFTAPFLGIREIDDCENPRERRHAAVPAGVPSRKQPGRECDSDGRSGREAPADLFRQAVKLTVVGGKIVYEHP